MSSKIPAHSTSEIGTATRSPGKMPRMRGRASGVVACTAIVGAEVSISENAVATVLNSQEMTVSL